MKKSVSLAIAAAMVLGSTVNAFAAQADEPAGLTVKVVGSDRISNNTIVLYNYNLPNNYRGFMRLTDESTGKSTTYKFADYPTYPKSIAVGTGEYSPHFGTSFSNGSGGSGGGGSFDYNTTGAKYQKVRIKLSDYSDYFNSDGTHTKETHGKDIRYNFREQIISDNEKYTSALFVESGGAVTAIVPDSNGYAEFMVSTKIGARVAFSTNFEHNLIVDGSFITGGGGGINRHTIKGLTIGDADSNGFVEINDATKIQLMLASRDTLDEAQVRCADTTYDSRISIDDVTAIQKYLAK